MSSAIEEEWDILQPEGHQAAIDSMPRRVQLVIEAAGGPIRYRVQGGFPRWLFKVVFQGGFSRWFRSVNGIILR